MIIKLGDKEVEFNPDFKFNITTKLSNPQYTPEISTKAAIVNFAVKEQGLEAQLLGIVVRKERPELEETAWWSTLHRARRNWWNWKTRSSGIVSSSREM